MPPFHTIILQQDEEVPNKPSKSTGLRPMRSDKIPQGVDPRSWPNMKADNIHPEYTATSSLFSIHSATMNATNGRMSAERKLRQE